MKYFIFPLRITFRGLAWIVKQKVLWIFIFGAFVGIAAAWFNTTYSLRIPILFQNPIVPRVAHKPLSLLNPLVVHADELPPSPTPDPCKPILNYLKDEREYVRTYVMDKVKKTWGCNQMAPLDNVLIRESGYDLEALNSYSYACGLGQALPCEKMGGKTLEAQVSWLMSYIKARYQNPANAWAFWKINNYY